VREFEPLHRAVLVERVDHIPNDQYCHVPLFPIVIYKPPERFAELPLIGALGTVQCPLHDAQAARRIVPALIDR
jgi:hypothetical protein